MGKSSRIAFGALAVALAFAAGAASEAVAQGAKSLKVEKAWARATAPGAAVGGGYLTIRNDGPAGDRLVGASSPVSARTELHEMAMDKDVMRMREVKSMDVPPRGTLELKPGGFHLMFVELKAPLKRGEKIPVTLKFEKAGEVKAEFIVEAVGAGAGEPGHHGAMKH